MFILVNDGAVPDPDFPMSANRVLAQRKFVYDLLRGKIAMALLKGTDYADSKVRAAMPSRRFLELTLVNIRSLPLFMSQKDKGPPIPSQRKSCVFYPALRTISTTS